MVLLEVARKLMKSKSVVPEGAWLEEADLIDVIWASFSTSPAEKSIITLAAVKPVSSHSF